MYTNYIIEKGDHTCKPKTYKLLIGPSFNCKWSIELNNNLKYDLNNEDQADWNKLLGISLFKLVPNDDNSIRLGYRYNVQTDSYELSPYYHVKNKIVFGLKSISIANKVTKLSVQITFQNKLSTLTITDESTNLVLLSESLRWNEGYTFGYENGFYFGGNQVAPNKLILKKYKH